MVSFRRLPLGLYRAFEAGYIGPLQIRTAHLKLLSCNPFSSLSSTSPCHERTSKLFSHPSEPPRTRKMQSSATKRPLLRHDLLHHLDPILVL